MVRYGSFATRAVLIASRSPLLQMEQTRGMLDHVLVFVTLPLDRCIHLIPHLCPLPFREDRRPLGIELSCCTRKRGLRTRLIGSTGAPLSLVPGAPVLPAGVRPAR